MKQKKFISIIFKSVVSESNLLLLIDLLKGLIGANIAPIYKNNILTVFMDSKIDIDFNEIIQSFNEDFYITALLFESGELYKDVDKNTYLNYIYEIKDHLLKLNILYINETVLVKNLIYSEVVKMNILKEYYSDYENKKIIKVFLECDMNISKASKELYMHRNTLMYKIDNFIKNTGYDIKKFQNAFIIYHII